MLIVKEWFWICFLRLEKLLNAIGFFDWTSFIEKDYLCHEIKEKDSFVNLRERELEIYSIVIILLLLIIMMSIARDNYKRIITQHKLIMNHLSDSQIKVTDRGPLRSMKQIWTENYYSLFGPSTNWPIGDCTYQKVGSFFN